MKETSLYGSNAVYYLDILLFYTSDRKINWYLKKNLIEKISDKKYNFLFEPNGFYEKDHIKNKPILIENLCVNCGSREQLTKHHIVPFSFRKYLPIEYKSHNSHDVLILCFTCHSTYEKKADHLKKDICKKYNVSMDGIILGYPNTYKELIRISNTLKVYHNDSIDFPIEKRERLRMKILEFFGYIPTDEKYEEILHIFSHEELSKRHIPYTKAIVEKLEDLDDFVLMWRKHFIENMKCDYLPTNWSIHNKKVYS